jgi:hypothetical protein
MYFGQSCTQKKVKYIWTACVVLLYKNGWQKKVFFKEMVKMKGSMDLNETSTIRQTFIQFSLIVTQKNIFNFKYKNGHFIYNLIIICIGINIKNDLNFLKFGLTRSFHWSVANQMSCDARGHAFSALCYGRPNSRHCGGYLRCLYNNSSYSFQIR